MQTPNMSQLLSTTKSELSNKIAQLKNSKTLSENKYYSQDLIPIEDIVYGLIFLKDGTIIKILEILPINYSEFSPTERDMIADTFGMKFKQMPDEGHIKMMNSMADITPCVQNIREAVKNETDARFLSRVEDYISHITELQKTNTIRKRFFYIFEYQGNLEGKYSDNINEIYEVMFQEMGNIAEAHRACGNLVIDMLNDSNATIINM